MNNIKIINNIKISQISIGRFWHFHLARGLHQYAMLDKIFTGYPMFKLKSEQGIPKWKIKSFPYLQTPYIALIKYFNLPTKILQKFEYYAPTLLDNYAAKQLSQVNILIAQERAGLVSGKKIKKYKLIFYFLNSFLILHK